MARIKQTSKGDFCNVLGLGEEQLEHREAVCQTLVVAEQQDGGSFFLTLKVGKDEHSPQRKLVAQWLLWIKGIWRHNEHLLLAVASDLVHRQRLLHTEYVIGYIEFGFFISTPHPPHPSSQIGPEEPSLLHTVREDRIVGNST